jgi:hypothetical protein
MTVIPHPPSSPDLAPCDFSVPQLKIKLKGCHFDTTEVNKAESQAVLNTRSNHDFQEAGQKHWEQRICEEGTASRVMVARRP